MKRTLIALVLLVLTLGAVTPRGQTVLAAQIDNFSRALRAGVYAFSNLDLTAGGYANFGTTLGTTGYGIRDSGGIIQLKNSGGSWTTPSGGASPSSTYLTQTLDSSLPNSQALGALGSGLVFNTTITGVQSIYGGATCTNQFVSALSAAGVATCSSLALGTITITGTLLAANFPALTGDVTTPGASLATTLATVNATVGSFGSATAMGTFTVNGKGLITAAASVTPQLTLTNTYFSSLSGANLTAIPTTALTGVLAAAQFPAMTGDVTNTGGTLATTVGKIGGSAVALGSAFTTVGAGGLTLTIGGATNVTLPASGTLVSTTVTSLASLTTVGTIGTGVWQGTAIGPTYGGTGVNNGSATLTLGGNHTIAGAFASVFTLTAGTTVTFPTTGTLVNTNVTSLPSLTTVGVLNNVSGSGTLGAVASPFTSLIIGTAATNNLTVTPAAFAAGVVATVDDPGFTTAKLALVKRGTIAFTSGAILGGACAAVVTGTLTGLATTSTVTASLAAAVQTNWQKGVTFFIYPTPNTVNLQVCNPTAGSITPETATFNFTAIVP